MWPFQFRLTYPVQLPLTCPSSPISRMSCPSAHLHVLLYFLFPFPLVADFLHGGAGNRSSVSLCRR